jgi:hypothetical protein
MSKEREKAIYSFQLMFRNSDCNIRMATSYLLLFGINNKAYVNWIQKIIPINLALGTVPSKDVVTLMHLKPAQVLIRTLKSSCDEFNIKMIYLDLKNLPGKVSK